MKELLGVFCFVLFFATQAAAAPVAPPVPWTKAFVKKSGKSIKELNAAVIPKIPSEAAVATPVYPGAYYYQSNTRENGDLTSVVLVSTDAPEKVRAWYEKEAPDAHHVTVKPFVLYEWMAKTWQVKGMKSEIRIDVAARK